MRPEACGAAASAALALLTYLNALPAGFVFDDGFAIVRNGDVTRATQPLSALFLHDFWGQDIRSATSHKSYRPLTVLVFRLTHQAWRSLPSSWTHPLSAELTEDIPGSEQCAPLPLPLLLPDPKLDPSAKLLATREPSAAAGSSQTACSALYDQCDPDLDLYPDPDQAGMGVTSFLLLHLHLPSWATGLAFAAHPVHTEAVAGCVGMAELLAALCCLTALMWRLTWLLLHPKTARLALTLVVAGGYVALRGAVAGDQLVRIYRKVENPLPFIASPLMRGLSTVYLHTLYVGLLVWPSQLSCDWSHPCVPLIERLDDPRNARSAVLLLVLLLGVLVARPWAVLRAAWQQAGRAVQQAHPSPLADRCCPPFLY
ncbi:hypothetical protein V8C86DRAFT_3022551 [Haematococcus lacustris]